MTTSPVMGITEEILGEIERAGWKLVPVEPTPEMIERSQYWHRCREPQVPPENFRGFYDALLAAAPAAPVAAVSEPVAFYWDDSRKVHGPYFGRPSPDAIERAGATPVFLYADPTAAERDALRAEVEALREIRKIASQCAANGGYLCSRDLIELRELLKK